jgi:predicted enzyme related to lactoylglutathione lyase
MTNNKADLEPRSGSLQKSQAFAKLPASDIDRAKRFYSEKLGLTPSFEMPPRHFTFDCGGSLVLLFPSQGRASGDHDQIAWLVADIEDEVRTLKARGVEFGAPYDDPGATWNGEIAETGVTRYAYFKDSEGNVLSLVQILG